MGLRGVPSERGEKLEARYEKIQKKGIKLWGRTALRVQTAVPEWNDNPSGATSASQVLIKFVNP